jgi:hypothetical protein
VEVEEVVGAGRGEFAALLLLPLPLPGRDCAGDGGFATVPVPLPVLVPLTGLVPDPAPVAPGFAAAALRNAAIDALTNLCKLIRSLDRATLAEAEAAEAGAEADPCPPLAAEADTTLALCATLITNTLILCSIIVCTASLSFTRLRTFSSRPRAFCNSSLLGVAVERHTHRAG